MIPLTRIAALDSLLAIDPAELDRDIELLENELSALRTIQAIQSINAQRKAREAYTTATDMDRADREPATEPAETQPPVHDHVPIEHLIANCLRRIGPARIADVCRDTGLKRSAVEYRLREHTNLFRRSEIRPWSWECRPRHDDP
jgi:hypothetical protein